MQQSELRVSQLVVLLVAIAAMWTGDALAGYARAELGLYESTRCESLVLHKAVNQLSVIAERQQMLILLQGLELADPNVRGRLRFRGASLARYCGGKP